MDCDRPALTSYEQLAGMIDLALVRPDLTSSDVRDGCNAARRYSLASVFVRPTDVDLAVSLLEGSGVVVGSVAGFPHGSQTTAVKLYETRDLLRRGAKEIDMVINIGQMLSREFQHVEAELNQMAQTCHDGGALLKVIFENAYLTDDLKIIACKLCKRAGVDFAKTSTGAAPSGCTIEDLRLMYEHCAPRVRVKAAGGIGGLDQALAAYEAGSARIGSSSPGAILDEWKRRLAERVSGTAETPGN